MAKVMTEQVVMVDPKTGNSRGDSNPVCPDTDEAAGAFGKAASRMAILLSALPIKERGPAKIELVGQVTDQMNGLPSRRSLYPPGNVVAQEIKRIAHLLSEVFRNGLSDSEAALWGSLSIAIGRQLADIEFDACETNARITSK